jgi:hypothetical protein
MFPRCITHFLVRTLSRSGQQSLMHHGAITVGTFHMVRIQRAMPALDARPQTTWHSLPSAKAPASNSSAALLTASVLLHYSEASAKHAGMRCLCIQILSVTPLRPFLGVSLSVRMHACWVPCTPHHPSCTCLHCSQCPACILHHLQLSKVPVTKPHSNTTLPPPFFPQPTLPAYGDNSPSWTRSCVLTGMHAWRKVTLQASNVAPAQHRTCHAACVKRSDTRACTTSFENDTLLDTVCALTQCSDPLHSTCLSCLHDVTTTRASSF